MATFVLVPGAWIGGWAWGPVARGLRGHGHDAYPITLTGLGERVHLARPEVDLATHVADVVNVIEAEDLEEVVLIGHSYAGIVVTGVADRVSDRLAHLVYLDSAPFENDEAYLDVTPTEAQQALRRTVEEQGDGWRLPFPGVDAIGQQASLAGLGDAARGLMSRRAAAQPFRTYTHPLRLTGDPATEPGYGRTIIACDDMRELLGAGTPRFQALTRPAWRREDLATGHWPMLSAPEELVEVLDSLTR